MNFIKKIIEKKAFKSNELSKNQLANLIVRNPIKDIPNFGDPIVDTQFKIGDIIACNYILLNLVGKGGMGVVYLVYNKNLDYTFALKTIKEEFSSDANARYFFKREIETWIKLGQHPYIVSALDVFQFNGRYYVGMEFISPSDEMEGSSLEYYIRRGPLKTAQIIKWAIQFCFGIEYAYKNGLSCHLDIKPSNILIDLDGNVRISDFGLSKIKYNSYENLTFVYNNIKSCYLTQYGCGTPPYMPPEQFRSGKFN
ncbi:MAG: serine/threonine-protein kinase, partial [Candidatus Hodarchaeota archaeon]